MDIDVIKSLKQKFETPFYVFDEKQFISNYKRMYEAFSSRYPHITISYAYKANHTPYICKVAKSLGAFAEVSSEMEYYEAKELIGYDDSEIIYNGVCKGEGALNVIERGGIVNIDSLDEARSLDPAGLHGKGVGLRVNIPVGNGIESRFGVTIDEIPEVLEILEQKELYVAGLHCHCTKARSLRNWKFKVRGLLKIADAFFNNRIEYLDLGGGLYSNMPEEMTENFSGYNGNWEEYAELVATMVKEHFGNEELPRIILEMGTPLVADTMSLVADVTAVKKAEDKKYAICNCGMYDIGEGSRKINYPVTVLSNSEVETSVDFTGNTCMEADIFHRGYTGCIGVGSTVVIGGIGAYSIVAKPPFIIPTAMMVTGEGEIIKHRQTYRQVFETYV